MLYRHRDGSYTASTADPDGPRRDLTKIEGDAIVRNCGAPPEMIAQILAEGEQGLEGFVIT